MTEPPITPATPSNPKSPLLQLLNKALQTTQHPIAKNILLGMQIAFSDGNSIKVFLLGVVFLGRFNADPDHTAANGIILAVLNLILTLNAPIYSTTNFLPTLFGKLESDTASSEEKIEVKKDIVAFFQAGLICATLATLFVELAFSNSEYLLTNVFKQDKNVASIASSFLHKTQFYIPALHFYFPATQLILTTNETNILNLSSVILLLTMSCTAFAAFYWNMQTTAVIAGFTIHSYSETLLFNAFILKSKKYQSLQLLKNIFLDYPRAIEKFQLLLRDGLTLTIRIGTDLLFMFAMTTLSISFGVNQQAALGLIFQFAWLATFFAVGISIANKISLGKAFGVDNSPNNIFITSKNCLIAATIGSSVFPLFLLFPDLVMKLFSPQHPEVQQFVRVISPCVAAASFFEGCGFTPLMFMQLNQIGKTANRQATFLRFAGASLGLFVAYIAAFAMDGGALGLARGLLVFMGSSAIMLGILLQHKLAPHAGKASLWDTMTHFCCKKSDATPAIEMSPV